jgi:hypothetical protein
MMTTQQKTATKISFPFGLYLQQLFSADVYVRFINPFGFWRRYRINHLETCQELDTVEYLERCYHLKWRSPSYFDYLYHQTSYGDTQTSAHKHSLLAPTTPKIIFIVQPSIQLKYRGVTYNTTKILGVNINNAKIDPSLVKFNNLEQPLDSFNLNTPEMFGSN